MMVPPQVYSCRLTMIAEMLGSQPAAEDVHSQYIQSKAPVIQVNGNGAYKDADIDKLLIRNAVAQAEERGESVEELRGRTVFLRDELGRPVIRDYVLKGFFKEAWRACKKISGSTSSETRQGIAEIDRYVFIEGAGEHRDKRYIVLNIPGGTQVQWLERPLRAQTAQGPRVALASSEMAPVGAYLDLRIINIAPNLIKRELLEEWLSYGQWIGLGQWRTGSHGRFEYRLRLLDRK